MDAKWIMFWFAMIMIGLSIEQSYTKYSETKCKQAYVQSNKNAAEIKSICE